MARPLFVMFKLPFAMTDSPLLRPRCASWAEDLRKMLPGGFIIVALFLFARLPFFLQLPVAYIGEDSGQYYNVLSAIEQGSDQRIGYPQIGYPLFLKCCELIHDSLWFVCLAQGLLQLTAALFFFISYGRAFGRFTWLAAILIGAYLTSPMSLFWDSAIFPDSLLGSLYMFCAALLLNIVVLGRYRLLPFYALVATMAIAVRPSALILLPPFLLLMVYMAFRLRTYVQVVFHSAFMLLSLLGLAALNWSTPVFGDFHIITHPEIPSYQSKVISRTLDDPEFQQLAQVLPHPEIVAASRFENITGVDSIFEGYRQVWRGFTVGRWQNGDSIVLNVVTSEQRVLRFDSLAAVFCVDSEACALFQDRWASRYADSAVVFSPEMGMKFSLVHTPYFFYYFYMEKLEGGAFAFDDYYGEMLGHLIQTNMVHGDWQRFSVNNLRLVAIDQVTRRTAKELWMDSYWSAEQAADRHESLLNSMYYRYLLEPYFRIHAFVFRNPIWPLLFLTCMLLGLLTLLRGFSSPVSLYVLLSGSMLMATLVLHVWLLTMLYWRYTYQITFLYHFVPLFLPFLLLEFRHVFLRKENVNNDDHAPR